jgi:hypothetical protein
MKKLGFIIAFSALFAVGMSAQTTNPPKKTPAPRAAVSTKPQAQTSTTTQTTSTATKAPASQTIVKGKKHTGKPAVASKPVQATTTQKQKAQ